MLRMSENERRKHQLERVRRAAQNKAQHADPSDLVQERDEPGSKCGPGEPTDAPIRASGRRPLSGAFRFAVSLSKQPDDGREHDIEQPRGQKRSRQPEQLDQHETADQDTNRCPEAIGEIEERKQLAGTLRCLSHQPAADQREGGAHEYRSGQDQQGTAEPLEELHAAP